MFQSIGDSLELKEVVQTLTSAVSSGTAVAAAAAATVTSSSSSGDKKPRAVSEGGEELKIGMPNF
jgi:hypothetical protein